MPTPHSAFDCDLLVISGFWITIVFKGHTSSHQHKTAGGGALLGLGDYGSSDDASDGGAE